MRTEEEVLKDFEKLGYKIKINNGNKLKLGEITEIEIDKFWRIYRKDFCYINRSSRSVNLEEHKLLNELFSIWGWL